MSKTIIIDIDGVIFKHPQSKNVISDIIDDNEIELLPGVLDKFNEWYSSGYNILILSGRPESTRQITEWQLQNSGLFYDQLILGVKHFPRVIINDTKPNGLVTAIACPVERNVGLEGLNI